MRLKIAVSLWAAVFLAFVAIASCKNCIAGKRKAGLKRRIVMLVKLVDKILCDDGDLYSDCFARKTSGKEDVGDSERTKTKESEAKIDLLPEYHDNCSSQGVENKYLNCWIRSIDFNEKFTHKGINVDLCTHATLIHFFRLGNDSSLQMQENVEKRFENFQPLVKMFQTKNKPVILAVGLDEDGLPPGKFSAIASKEGSRSLFVNSVMQVIEKYNLDGLLLNWQYPVFWEDNILGKSSAYDGINYVHLMRIFSEKLKSKKRILQGYSTANLAFSMFFDFKKLNSLVDHWFLPFFHFEGPTSTTTAISSPYNRAESMVSKHMGIISPDKLLLGIPTFYKPVVVDPKAKGIRLGTPLKNLPTNQRLSTFRSLCEEAAKGGMTVVHNENNVVNSYAFVKNDWVSYDSSIVAINKVRMVLDNNLAGVFVPFITVDDYDGKACNCGNFHILRSIKNALMGSVCVVKTCP
ncbi:Hypothetical predicted protein [Cloeon dipterum]|uniref:GH18 domain-containing protein n=3 Tax=Cloeon dipterum TaxID=197152 RepID=A0A8S1DLB6_9INSE|nr:Hypothetical predicted protein [Cloeon dipterum]